MKQAPFAMSFLDEDIKRARQTAERFAGPHGHVATLPEIALAKARNTDDKFLWSRYHHSNSQEYFGTSKFGTPLIIVSHGKGPLSTTESFNNATPVDKRGQGVIFPEDYMTISQQEFTALENGTYGDIEVVPFFEYKRFLQRRGIHDTALTAEQALEDPLITARLGTAAEEFLFTHQKITWEDQESNGGCCVERGHGYDHLPRKTIDAMIREEGAFGSVLSLNTPVLSTHHHHQPHNIWDSTTHTSYVTEISDGTNNQGVGRFIGIRIPEYKGQPVHAGAETLYMNMRRNPNKFFVPSNEKPRDFFRVERLGEQAYTSVYQEDSPIGLPDHPITQIDIVAEATFTTPIGGYYGIFRYGEDEVRAIMPSEANAYALGQPDIVWEEGNPTHHTAPITFFRADVDVSRRAIRPEELRTNPDLVMELL